MINKTKRLTESAMLIAISFVLELVSKMLIPPLPFGGQVTLAMMLLGSIFITISGGFSELPQIISEFPWGYMLMFYWASFGVTMGVISMLAARKK